MAFLSTDDVGEWLRAVLADHFELRRKELTNGPEKPPPILKWVTSEFAFPEGSDQGDYPKGLVNFDGDRTSERREQDSGETAVWMFKVTIVFSIASIGAEKGNTMAVRYMDAIFWTLMREAKIVKPSTGTALPGLFRAWPKAGRVMVSKEMDLMGAEVDVEILADSVFSASVT